MDFVSDELSFVVAGLEQVLEVAVFPRQCLLGPLAIRHISETRRRLACPRVREPVAYNVGIQDIAIFSQQASIHMTVKPALAPCLDISQDHGEFVGWVNVHHGHGEQFGFRVSENPANRRIRPSKSL